MAEGYSALENRRVSAANGVLHQLCAPMLKFADRLPAPQRDALRIVLGSAAGLLSRDDRAARPLGASPGAGPRASAVRRVAAPTRRSVRSCISAHARSDGTCARSAPRLGVGSRRELDTALARPGRDAQPASNRQVHLPSTGRATGQGYPRDITGALRGLAREGEVMPLVKGNPDELAAPLICSCRTALA